MRSACRPITAREDSPLAVAVLTKDKELEEIVAAIHEAAPA